MIRLGCSTVFTGFGMVFLLLLALSSQAQSPAPDFREVYDLVREHLNGVSETELNRIAVEAFVSALGPKVSLSEGPDATNTPAVLVGKSALFEGRIGYFRIKRVEEGLNKRLTDAYEKLATNNLSGLVLDLRYATGQNYPAAAAVADLFVKKERPLMDWGKGLVRSTEKNQAITIPVAVLVDAKTAGAAEALAAVLRETGTALVLGNKTAGQAMIAQEYPLKGGGSLRIASGPIQLADGSALSPEGVKPDIAVEVSPEDEKAYYADAFAEPASSNRLASGSAVTISGVTNRNRRTRLNEAELVRERRDGFILEVEPPSGTQNTDEKPVVRDPALARALDVLKGLAVIRQSHS